VTAIASLVPRRRCTFAGTVASVTTYRRPWLRTDAELSDGTGTVVLRFSGRDSVPGLRPGRKVVVEGTPARVGDRTIVLNPLYAYEAGEPST
jgi:hypothetical protein